MTDADTRAIVTISLLAAFADGDKHERERAEVRRIADSLAQDQAVHMPTLVQEVLMKRVTLAGAAAQLSGPEARMLAYEMAVCVCDADGAHTQAEQRFLDELRGALGLDAGRAQATLQQAEAMAQAPLGAGPGLTAAAMAATGAAAAGAPSGAAPQPGTGRVVDEAALDQAILNAAITNGALELLPETLSTMAIIPLQMRLVYRIGQSYGYELDKGHIKDFLATVGVGLTSQYLEQAGRKLLTGLLGRRGGGLLGGLGRQAVSSGMSFAATYALGHVAKRYYAGGRQLSGQMLKDAYNSVLGQAQQLHGRYLPQMQEQARTLDAGRIMAMVQGR